MKLPPIIGTIATVHPVRQVKKGYTQAVIVHVPAKENEDGDLLRKEHFYVVHSWSNKHDDSRFLKPEHVGAECKAECYLDGERWQGRTGFEYNNRIKLSKWAKEESETKQS